MFHCLYTTLYGWLQNFCVCIYLINNVINLYVFIITNFVYNETPLPESSMISKKLSRKNWSLHFSIANIRLPGVHLSWPGTSAVSYWSLLPSQSTERNLYLKCIPSSLPTINTLHRPDESLLGRAHHSLSWLASPDKDALQVLLKLSVPN